MRGGLEDATYSNPTYRGRNCCSRQGGKCRFASRSPHSHKARQVCDPLGPCRLYHSLSSVRARTPLLGPALGETPRPPARRCRHTRAPSSTPRPSPHAPSPPHSRDGHVPDPLLCLGRRCVGPQRPRRCRAARGQDGPEVRRRGAAPGEALPSAACGLADPWEAAARWTRGRNQHPPLPQGGAVGGGDGLRCRAAGVVQRRHAAASAAVDGVRCPLGRPSLPGWCLFLCSLPRPCMRRAPSSRAAPAPSRGAVVSQALPVEIAVVAGEAAFITGTALTMVAMTLTVRRGGRRGGRGRGAETPRDVGGWVGGLRGTGPMRLGSGPAGLWARLGGTPSGDGLTWRSAAHVDGHRRVPMDHGAARVRAVCMTTAGSMAQAPAARRGAGRLALLRDEWPLGR